MSIDMNKVEQFAGQVVSDISATFSGVMTNIGHKLGLYKAMAGAGAMSSQMLADKTGTHARQSLKTDGTVLLVEPAAADKVNDNINPVSRLYYAASTAVCTPCSRSQEVGLALGAQAGEKRLSEVMREAGFGNIRRAAETPFNMVLESRIN